MALRSRSASRKGLCAALALLVSAAGGGCSSAPKKTVPELAGLRGKKVALITVQAEPTARKIIEVALVNQLTKRGTFELVSKEDIEAARARPQQDPLDTAGIARGAGAEVALTAHVLKFDATTRDGHSSFEVEDSQLAAERGEEERKSTRLVRVRALRGEVRIKLAFTDLANGDVRTADAEAEREEKADELKGSIRLTPKMRFLEELTNRAFEDFFERYQ